LPQGEEPHPPVVRAAMVLQRNHAREQKRIDPLPVKIVNSGYAAHKFRTKNN
jgi:hypothetical protein